MDPMLALVFVLEKFVQITIAGIYSVQENPSASTFHGSSFAPFRAVSDLLYLSLSLTNPSDFIIDIVNRFSHTHGSVCALPQNFAPGNDTAVKHSRLYKIFPGLKTMTIEERKPV